MATSYTRTPARSPQSLGPFAGSPRYLYLLTIALILAVLVDVAPAGADDPSAAQRLSAVKQTVTIAVLPPISQPGKTTASPAGARTVVTASFRPKKVGRPAVLERRQDGSWKAVDKARLGANGRVSFSAPTRIGGQRSHLPRARRRLRRPAQRRTPMPVRTNAWGAPAFVDTFNGNALGPAWEHRGQAYNPGGRPVGLEG